MSKDDLKQRQVQAQCDSKDGISDRVKFTVIVPTRERPDTLVHCLRTLVAQDYDNVTFLVSDNFSQDRTKEVCESFGDQRICYINTGRRISMSHNYEFALGHVTDGWVTIVGDDDGLLPGALRKVSEVVGLTDAQAIITPWCLYYWPNSGCISSISSLPLGKGWKIRRSAEWLRKLMSGHAAYPDLPMLYTGGFVDNRAIERVRRIDGTFFHASSPDVFSAIALGCVTESYLYLNEPVAIAGVSAQSSGASNLGQSSDNAPAVKFYSEGNIPFHRVFGDEWVRSLPLVVYDSYLHAEFLHGNTLRIGLAGQLSQALATAKPAQREELRRYCSGICTRNGLDIAAIERDATRVARRRRVSLLRHVPDVVVPKALSFDAMELGARNVYDFSLIAKSMYFSLAENRWWRVRTFVGYSGRFVKSVLRWLTSRKTRVISSRGR